MSEPSDLFGHPTGPAQHNLFGAGPDRLAAPKQDFSPSPELVRRRLRALLEHARRADRMPWSPRDARMWQAVFPNMANWLPEEEAAQLRLDFAREIDRLNLAA